jgi:hypothetical protein
MLLVYSTSWLALALLMVLQQAPLPTRGMPGGSRTPRTTSRALMASLLLTAPSTYATTTVHATQATLLGAAPVALGGTAPMQLTTRSVGRAASMASTGSTTVL